VRVRIEYGRVARITIKSAASGLVRGEFEYEVPMHDAVELLRLCGDHALMKTRHLVPAGDLTWEIDAFEGRHAGLVIAEVELPNANYALPLPDWAGKEVTDDPRFSNEHLARPA
jgi:adenylate cyclase